MRSVGAVVDESVLSVGAGSMDATAGDPDAGWSGEAERLGALGTGVARDEGGGGGTPAERGAGPTPRAGEAGGASSSPSANWAP